MRPELHRLCFQRGIGKPGDGDTRNRARSGRDELQSVVAAKTHVGDQQIRRLLGEQLPTFVKSSRWQHLVSCSLEECREALTRGGIVLDNQDSGAALHHPGSSCATCVPPPSGAGRRDFVISNASKPVARCRQICDPVSYTHLRAHETPEHLVCRLLLEK